MKALKKWLLVALVLSGTVTQSHAEVYLTPWLNFTGGGELESSDGSNFDIEPSASYSLSAETDFQTGRIGMFYAHQSSDVSEVQLKSSIQYLMFQSSIYYALPNDAYSYIGVGVGGSYIDANWVDNSTGFAASIFGGFEYPITNSIRLTTQARWLGTVVDNDTAAACNLPSSSTNGCIVQFKTDWMNQFTVGIGVVMRY
ncbi:porin family protein [Vibrio sp. 404]|uniref:Porin family protein n=2 Tax=Gammaproteobacteria TaxID=1236 RepID=A0A7W2FPF4_9VIBR|nr:porin family protein [Vibrio marinisediminis]MBA5761838.1 porin family protein [Vibrio marinisediminis]